MSNQKRIALVFLGSLGCLLTFGSWAIGQMFVPSAFCLLTTVVFVFMNWMNMKNGKWNWWEVIISFLVLLLLAAIFFPVMSHPDRRPRPAKKPLPASQSGLR